MLLKQKYISKIFKIFASQSNLTDIVEGGKNLVNFNEHKSIRTHRIALYMNGNNETYFCLSIILNSLCPEISSSSQSQSCYDDSPDITLFSWFIFTFFQRDQSTIMDRYWLALPIKTMFMHVQKQRNNDK